MAESAAAEAEEIQEKRFQIPTEDDLQTLLGEKDSKNTKHTIAGAVKCFRDFLKEAGKPEDFESFEKEELNECLRNFYAAARKSNGDKFKRSALQSYRYGLRKHILEKMKLDIFDSSFTSNDIYKAVLVNIFYTFSLLLLMLTQFHMLEIPVHTNITPALVSKFLR